jgi:serine phosphatase RsbU (regulator of sigma subunit)
MDPLLARQLRRLGLDSESPPTDDQWKKLLSTLDDHYRKTEEDRTMLVRSMEVSTDEMDELRRKAENQRDTFRGVIGAFQSVIETILGVLEREGSGSIKVGPARDTDAAGPNSTVSKERILIARREIEQRLAQSFSSSDGSTSEVTAVRTGMVRLSAQILRLITGIGEADERRFGIVRELREAMAVQRVLQAEEEIHEEATLSIAGKILPAEHLSGDFWCHLPVGNGRTLVVVGDATGHGPGAALVTVLARAILQERARGGLTAEAALAALHRALLPFQAARMSMTAIAALHDPAARTLTLANAGHRPAFHVRDGEATAFPGAAAPLGSTPEFTMDPVVIPFAPGDLLVLFSDGLVEAESGTGEPFSERRVRAVAARTASQGAVAVRDALWNSLESHVTGPFGDDVTVVTLAAR